MHKRHFSIIFLIISFIIICSLLFSPFFKQRLISKFEESDETTNTISPSENTAQFHFIDVGQGDCILIQSGDTNILIDSGTVESGSTVYTYLRNLKIDTLDYFIGTHPHEDHLGGAASVLSSIKVKKVFLNSDTSSSYFYERFVDTLISKNIKPVLPQTDCIYEIGPFRIKFLSPTEDFGDTNDNSLVVMVQFGEIKALFTGDSERAVEAKLLSGNNDISADILKVGHHGSRYASSAEFLNAVYPSVAVIQCGRDNSYGHPHKETIQRLNNVGSTILRTDEEGSIVLITDGKKVQRSDGEIYEKASESPKLTLTYFGNLKSKVFHTESCPNLPGEQNRVEFSSREEAINLGYKECGNCNP